MNDAKQLLHILKKEVIKACSFAKESEKVFKNLKIHLQNLCELHNLKSANLNFSNKKIQKCLNVLFRAEENTNMH